MVASVQPPLSNIRLVSGPQEGAWGVVFTLWLWGSEWAGPTRRCPLGPPCPQFTNRGGVEAGQCPHAYVGISVSVGADRARQRGLVGNEF